MFYQINYYIELTSKYLLFFLIAILFSCCQEVLDVEDELSRVKDDIAEFSTNRNKENLAWESKIDTLYWLGENNLSACAEYSEKLAKIAPTSWKKGLVYITYGEILYDLDSTENALKIFEKSELISRASPRSLANKAGCYLRMGQMKKSLDILKNITKDNKSNYWLVGNCYEAMDSTEKAIETYQYLYKKDKDYYHYCKQRIDELASDSITLFSELQYQNRGMRMRLSW